MISRETENIQSISEVEGAFRAITADGDKPYVTKEEIFQVKWLLNLLFVAAAQVHQLSMILITLLW